MLDAIMIILLVVALIVFYVVMLQWFKKVNLKLSHLWNMLYEIQNDVGRIEEISEDIETLLFYQREIKDYMTYQNINESEVSK